MISGVQHEEIYIFLKGKKHNDKFNYNSKNKTKGGYHTLNSTKHSGIYYS